MDVRCDRCQTEYELDDGIVTEAGASVQCTTCGLTFFVRRGGATSAVGAGGAEAFSTPETPEWTLSTEGGKVHRFRDFSTLNRWIVERKVTRDDRVSRAGGAWQVVGEIAELAPFFAVVEEADRARLAASIPAPTARTSSPGLAAPLGARMPGMTAPAPAPAAPSHSVGPRIPEDGPTVPNRRLETEGGHRPDALLGKGRALSSSDVPAADGSSRREPSLADGSFNDLEPESPSVSHGGRNIVLFVLLVAGVGGATYAWLSRREPAPSATVEPAVAPLPPSPSMTPPSGTGEPAAAPAEANPAQALAPVAEVSGGNAGTGAVDAASAPTAVRTREKSRNGDATTVVAAGEAGPRHDGDGNRVDPTRPALPVSAGSSYDKLVAEGDRALARGGAGKAEKLYSQALALRPTGVAALTGSAYVLLGRQRHFKAIEVFRRAIAIQPTYGPALFGIAESYRARGDASQALLAYRQYLALAPAGAEAPAARRQIKDLSSDDDNP